MIDFYELTTLQLVSLLVLGTAFIIIFAQITIPLPKIPITGQSFAVLVTAFLLRSTLGTGAALLYLLLGALGLPVFADHSGGISVLKGTSGGYLFGFLPAAFVVGKLSETGWDVNFWWIAAAMAIGTAIILIFGIAQLTYFLGFGKALQYGLYPVLPGAIVKIGLGAAVVLLVRRLVALFTA